MKKVMLILLIIFSISSVGVVALSLCNAKDIEYNASDTKWDVDTVEDALNDLYQINGSNPNNSCINVATPNLGSNNKLIPVIISDDGTITKVNKNNSNWYNYCEKKWANAVILNDGVSVPSDNSTISMSNIEAMFVWIPKYKYRLWNVNTTGLDAFIKVHSIDIVFDTTNTEDKEGISCKTPMISGDIGECTNGEYMTHPSFISFGVNGFWVGKFETGYKGATDKTSAQATSNDPNLIIVKPNAFSWRANTVKNIFESSINYEPDLDSHMMKNTEWGAVVYLSHSIYGIDHEININNNNAYKTGYSATPNTNQQYGSGQSGDDETYNMAWDSKIGFTASTTGNITGIYDMAGGNYEYVAGYKAYGSSGFTTKIPLVGTYEEKYYDSYPENSSISTYNNMILGDATGELGPFKTSGEYVYGSWYSDYSAFIENQYPWFRRGSVYDEGLMAGAFYFGRYTGGARADNGSRLVLAPSN